MMNWKKKYKGIPLFLIILLLASGVAIAAFTYVYKLEPTVQRPVTEQHTETFNVAEGYSFTKTKWLDLALPESYDLKYKLTGDTDDLLESESATISLDLDDDGIIESDMINNEPTKIIDSLEGAVTFDDVTATAAGQIRQKITISATAKDSVLVGTDYGSGDDDPAFDTVTTSLSVEMEPTKS